MYFFNLLAWCITLFSGCVTAQSDLGDTFISSLTLRQAGSSKAECNATCTYFNELADKCVTPHCGCRVPFLQVQGDCRLCQAKSPGDAAGVQMYLDADINPCHREGFQLANVQLDLPPAAAKIIQQVDRDGASLRRMQAIFLALQIAGGHIGLVVVLLFAIFSGRVRRDPTFINFCVTWIISSVVFSMLLYRGTDGHTIFTPLAIILPSDHACLAQAALTEGAQVMTAGSTLALIIQLWLSTQAAIYKGPTNGVEQKQITRWTTCALLVTPYILFITFALPALFIGLYWNQIRQILAMMTASPTNFYCMIVGAEIKVSTFRQAVYGVTLGLLTLTVIFDFLIIRIVFRRWWYFRRMQAQGGVLLSTLLRVIVCTIYRTVVVITYGSALISPPERHPFTIDGESYQFYEPGLPIWLDMLQAALPLVAAIIFGVNRELIQSCMFWRRTGTSNDASAQSVKPVSTAISTEDGLVILETDSKVGADPAESHAIATPRAV